MDLVILFKGGSSKECCKVGNSKECCDVWHRNNCCMGEPGFCIYLYEMFALTNIGYVSIAAGWAQEWDASRAFKAVFHIEPPTPHLREPRYDDQF